jgi:hypothetical protein
MMAPLCDSIHRYITNCYHATQAKAVIKNGGTKFRRTGWLSVLD